VTATINAQAIPWVLSGGIGFSNLKSLTYANAPIIVNGVPSVDSGGKTLTKVTLTSTIWHVPWIDPAAALVAVPILIAEGRRTFCGVSRSCF
jgi:hypothetical protein